MPDHAIRRLKADKDDVQARSNGKCRTEVLRAILVAVTVMVIVSVHCSVTASTALVERI